MSKIILSTFLLLFILFATVFTQSFSYLTIADSDNETSLENSTRNAMTQAINWGNVRVNEEITINETIAVEAILRQYADSSDFFKEDRYLNVYQVSSKPPMIAVESYTKVQSPFMNMVNNFYSQDNSEETITRSREIVIFESKRTTK